MAITLHGTRTDNTDVITPDTTGVCLGVSVATSNSTISTTNTSFTASGLQVTITPKSVNSKFLMITSGGNVFPNNEQTEIHIIHYVNVGGAGAGAINNSNTKGLIRNGLVGGGEQKGMQSTCTFYDANTTSQLVFEPYFKSTNGSSTAYFNQATVEVNLTVMEFAG
tara:strand:- start:295 stop:792 length:498 start_codon:yes stop_codon:yes gene_type:complete